MYAWVYVINTYIYIYMFVNKLNDSIIILTTVVSFSHLCGLPKKSTNIGSQRSRGSGLKTAAAALKQN